MTGRINEGMERSLTGRDVGLGHDQQAVGERLQLGPDAAGPVVEQPVELVQALRHAERQGLVVRNVASLVPTPTGMRAAGRSLTVAQANELLTAVREHPREAAIVVGLTWGLRPGELLALAWDDVDLDARTLRVQRALVRVGGKLEVGTTKTVASVASCASRHRRLEPSPRTAPARTPSGQRWGSTGRSTAWSSRPGSARCLTRPTCAVGCAR